MSRTGVIDIRQAQDLAARCVVAFASSTEVNDRAIDALAKHLQSLVYAHDLPDWKRRGRSLELAGRGDPMPPSFHRMLGEELVSDLARPIENAVEFGIHDLYGAPTGKPREFLAECFRILAKWEVEAPGELPSGATSASCSCRSRRRPSPSLRHRPA